MSNPSDRAAQLSPVKRALLAVEQMQSKLDAVERARTEPIAVIGMGCRFPGGADSPEAFWRLLRDGVDTVSEVPADRWDVEDYFDPDPAVPGKMYTRWGAFLDGVDKFDPAFFGISPREAASLDPQQRLLLEVAWEGLEHAGQSLDALAGSKTGVFVGMMNNEYFQHLKLQGLDAIDAYYGTGNVLSSGAGRLSYAFSFQGPSMTVDTACSASLVATHLASQSLRAGECDMALAGGVNLILLPDVSIYMSQARTMAADGRCKTFDARADGYVRGEGCGIVVLKRLSDALAAGDPILALIRGSAVMHDGRSSGFTVPSGGAQQAVIRAALAQAGVAPSAIGYVEAHGTGTPLGDPVEMRALGAVLACERPHELLIGSVKTNIGHLEAAAGVAGLIKAVLSLQHGEVPPHLHFRELNPQIPLGEIGARIPTERLPWPCGERQRFAGISSFGLTGTIAHVVLEEAPAASAPADSVRDATAETAAAVEFQTTGGQPQLLTLSARDPEALRELARRYREHLSRPGVDETPADFCYTASMRRTHHEHRLALTGSTRAELAERLATFESGETQPFIAAGRKPAGQPPGVVFVFPGQGSQWVGMGRRLLRGEPVFRASVEQCDALIREQLGWSLLEELEADETRSRLAEIDVVQPALFAVQVALAALWRSWGIEPEAVVGQSMGEVAAAHVAGALSLTDAAKVICRRSRLLRRQSGAGSMAAVELSLEETRAALSSYEGRLSVGVSSSPIATVVSGETAALEELLATLERRGVFCRRIKVDIASHSPHMEPLREELLRELAEVEPLAPALPVYSTVIGARARELRFDAAYWWRNLREPVLFWGAVERLLEDGYQTFLEVSPHPVALGSIQQGLYAHGRTAALLPSLRREEDERGVLLGSLASLYASGHKVNWSGLFPRGGRCVNLPAYPWRRERFWAATATRPQGFAATGRDARGGDGRHPLLGLHVTTAHQSISHLWELRLELRDLPFLEDHRVQGAAVLPATAYLEMASAAATEVFAGRPFHLASVELRKALFVPAEGARLIQLSFTDEADGVAFRVDSRPEDAPASGDAWTTHATGRIRFAEDATTDAPEMNGLEAARALCREEVSADEFYSLLEAAGYGYGASFRSIERVWRREGEAIARLEISPQAAAGAHDYRLHPAVLDCGLQLLGATLPAGDAVGRPAAYMPTTFEKVRLHSLRPQCLWARAALRAGEGGAHLLKCDVSLFDEEGQVVAELVGVELQSLEGAASQLQASSVSDWMYEPRWEEQSSAAVTRAPHEGGGAWLVFADAGGVGNALSASLAERGERVFVVRAGAEYGRVGEGGFVARPSQKEDLRQLWEEVREAAPGGCREVVFLWGLDDLEADACSAESLDGAPLDACVSVVQLLQILDTEDRAARPRLRLVTRGAQAVGGERRIAVTQAPLWGLGRTLAQEASELFGGIIDLDGGEGLAECARRLHEELAASSDEPQVAFRRGARYVCRLERLSGRGEALRSPRFHADASYLITGGLGALGLEVARWMVGRGARRIILMGRAALPPRREWRRVEQGTPLAHRIEAIQELEALGAAVHLAAVDVADEAHLTDFLNSFAEENWPRIRGVVHAAGALRDATLMQLDAPAFKSVWRPKVVGGWLLHRAFAGAELDFMVFFSSAASLLGSPGQANYAAANAFMDALACERRAQGLPALSINWGAWSEVGLAATEERGGRLARLGFGGIPTRRGLEALDLLMAQDTPQAGVIPVDWALVRRNHPVVAALPLFAHVTVAGGTATDVAAAARKPGLTRDILIAAGEDERQRLLEDYFGELVSRILGVRRQVLDPLRPLNTLGLDSLMAIEFKNSVERTLRLSLPMVALMQGPSIRDLTARMLEQLAGHDEDALLPGSVAGAAVATEAGGLSLEQAEELLAGIDSLSPERVNSLLASLLE